MYTYSDLGRSLFLPIGLFRRQIVGHPILVIILIQQFLLRSWQSQLFPLPVGKVRHTRYFLLVGNEITDLAPSRPLSHVIFEHSGVRFLNFLTVFLPAITVEVFRGFDVIRDKSVTLDVLSIVWGDFPNVCYGRIRLLTFQVLNLRLLLRQLKFLS